MGDERTDRFGQVLENTYRITRLIGEGGMGAVYEAEHTRLPRRFAIKMLFPHVVANAVAVERFHREALVTSELGHPHIVDVIDFNHTPDGIPYIVMELLEGEDLEKRLARTQRLPPHIVSAILEQTASALEAVHSRGIIHRDLKPQNIFLCRKENNENYVKVVDFGISKIRGAGQALTRAHMVMGTPFYMSPEQARGHAEQADRRTDIFAMGVMLYEMLTGKLPFAGDSPDVVLYQVVHETPPSFRSHGLEISPVVEEVVLMAMAKKQEERWSTMSELAEAFANAAERTVIEFVRDPDKRPTDRLAPVAPEPTAPSDAPLRERNQTHADSPGASPSGQGSQASSGSIQAQDLLDQADTPIANPALPEAPRPRTPSSPPLPPAGPRAPAEWDTFREHPSVAPPGSPLDNAYQAARQAPGTAPPRLTPPAVPTTGETRNKRNSRTTFNTTTGEITDEKRSRKGLIGVLLFLLLGGSLTVAAVTRMVNTQDPAPTDAGTAATQMPPKPDLGAPAALVETRVDRGAVKEPKAVPPRRPHRQAHVADAGSAQSAASGKVDASRSRPAWAVGEDKPGKPPRSTRLLTLTTAPSGAKVLLGNRVLGQTPLKEIAIPTSEQVLKIQKPGYRRLQQTIEGGDEAVTLVLELDEAVKKVQPGNLRLAAILDGQPVRAFIFIDGVKAGESPMSVELAPGSHTIEAWSRGRKAATQTVVVTPGESRTLFLRLSN